jgi:hypothetical protein
MHTLETTDFLDRIGSTLMNVAAFSGLAAALAAMFVQAL